MVPDFNSSNSEFKSPSKSSARTSFNSLNPLINSHCHSNISNSNNNISGGDCVLVHRANLNETTSSIEGLPHLVLYRLWVDNGVENHEDLQASCEFGYEQDRHTTFCINPQHYKRKTNSRPMKKTLNDSNKPSEEFLMGNNGQHFYDFGSENPETELNTNISEFEVENDAHHYTVTHFEKDIQIGPIFHCHSQDFEINGYFNHNEDFLGQSSSSAVRVKNSISIGALVGLKSSKQAQILKINLGKGLSLNVTEKNSESLNMIDAAISDSIESQFSNKKLEITNNSQISIWVRNYQKKFEPKSNSDEDNQAESIQNTIDEWRIRPGETVPVFDFAKLAASLIDQTLIGYTDFLTFVESGTRLDISLGQSWKVGCEAPLEDQESPFSPNSDRFFPQCWIRVRLMAGSDIIDRILGNYHTLSNHLAEGK